MTQTFRLIDPGHGPRVVELRLEGKVIVATHGPLAGPHQISPIAYADETEAKQVLARRLHSLQKLGYQLGEHHHGLIARIAAEPDEVEHYLVYADWLLEQGDPRGELIRVMEGLERLPTNGDLDLRLAELWAQHELRFRRPGWASLDLRWRWGFVESLGLPPVPASKHRRIGWGNRLPQVIMSVFCHPSGRFIRRVRAGEQVFALKPDQYGQPLELERIR